MNYRYKICVIFFMIAGAVLFADPARMEARKYVMQQYQSELVDISRKEVLPEELGEWQDVIENTLFMLMRRTELFRGKVRLLIYEDPRPLLRVYPDGTVAVSTGLPDSIDSDLFSALGASSQRVRNFNARREQRLAPVCAVELARFALDLETKRIAAKQSISELDIFNADIFAEVLLRTADYPDGLVFEYLQQTSRQSPKNQERLKHFTQSEKKVQKTVEELSDVLFALKKKYFSSAAEIALSSLETAYPDTLYFARLRALGSFSLWQRDALLNGYMITGAAPFAGEREDELALLHQQMRTQNTGHILLDNFPQTPQLNNARSAAEKYISIIDETGLISIAGLLAVYAGEFENGLTKTRQMFTVDSDSPDCIAALNYASALYITGEDRVKAQALIERCIQSNTTGTLRSLSIPRGFCCDERRLLIYHAVMLKTSSQDYAAEQAQLNITKNYFPTGTSEAVFFRRAALGQTTDHLIMFWGKPSLIAYNYADERWLYKNFKASALIIGDAGNEHIQEFEFLQQSPVSLPSDLRVGDTRSSIEAVFGTPRYYALDCTVYHFNGLVFSVLYTKGTSRSITVRSLYD